MPPRKLKLIAPNSTPIIGIKLADGSISEFECTYDDDSRTFLYLLPTGNTAKVLKEGGTNILVDSNGNEWSSPDVEYHSVLHE